MSKKSKLKKNELYLEVEVYGALLSVKYVKSDEDFKKWDIEEVRSPDNITEVLDVEVLDYIRDELETKHV